MTRGTPALSSCTRLTAAGSTTETDSPATVNRCAMYCSTSSRSSGLSSARREYPLVELTKVGGRQHLQQAWLPDQHDLQQARLVAGEAGDHAKLLEHARREVLGLVDEQHGAAANRDQREEKVAQRRGELVGGGPGKALGQERVARDDAEIDQDLAQQLLDGQERIEHEGRESGAG